MKLSNEDFIDYLMAYEHPPAPRCPRHPEIVLRPVGGEPLVVECLYGCRSRLEVADREYRAALVAEWPRAGE